MVIAVEKQCLIYFVSLNFYPMKTTMKVMATLVACALLSSCITVSRPVAATGNPVGSKCGEAKSMIYLGLWSTGGDTNGIDKAAKEAGITKISHVDSYSKNYLFGLVIKQTTKVYGE